MNWTTHVMNPDLKFPILEYWNSSLKFQSSTMTHTIFQDWHAYQTCSLSALTSLKNSILYLMSAYCARQAFPPRQNSINIWSR